VCISPHSFSEKPSPRGCRHCWSNYVKYYVHCCVFSPLSLCLVKLSHPIGPPSCRTSLLSGSVHNPKFFVITPTNIKHHSFIKEIKGIHGRSLFKWQGIISYGNQLQIVFSLNCDAKGLSHVQVFILHSIGKFPIKMVQK
jgi:hypothetical protein